MCFLCTYQGFAVQMDDRDVGTCDWKQVCGVVPSHLGYRSVEQFVSNFTLEN